MLQEHWLTPADWVKFADDFPDNNSCGSSALREAVESGSSRCRPYGGIGILVKKYIVNARTQYRCIRTLSRPNNQDWRSVVRQRLSAVHLTIDRQLICSDVGLLDHIAYWRSQFRAAGCGYVIGGDFNSVLDSQAPFSKYINAFLRENALSRFDILYPRMMSSSLIHNLQQHGLLHGKLCAC